MYDEQVHKGNLVAFRVVYDVLRNVVGVEVEVRVAIQAVVQVVIRKFVAFSVKVVERVVIFIMSLSVVRDADQVEAWVAVLVR